MSKLYEDLSRKIAEREDLTEEQKQEILKAILETQDKKPNVLITGATGCGKSSTINALFNAEKAKVGTSPNPETMEITKYELNNLTLWDSPGLGDGAEADRKHAEGITNLLLKKDENGNYLIDVVLVILDGSSRDLGTSYELITNVIAPCLNENDHNRLIIGINQADMAMKGKHWDSENHKPDETLSKFLKEKENSVKERIKEGTGILVEPVVYAAGFKEEGEPQEPSYNLSKLLYYIMNSIPAEKRLNVVENLNNNKQMWASDDGLANYRGEIAEKTGETFVKRLGKTAGGITAGAAAGAAIGSVIPVIGTAIGGVVGGILGGITSVCGCFITTATCKSRNLPDDCHELTSLRHFRDTFMKKDDEMKKEVEEYYDIAPKICSNIDNCSNSAEIYENIWQTYLKSAVSFVDSGENEKAHSIYKQMVLDLKEKYLRK